MRFLKLGLLLMLLTSMLSGCGSLPFSNYKTKEKDIEDYNTLVQTTLANYAKAKLQAEDEKERLFDYILKDQQWNLAEKAKPSFPKLTQEEKEAFKMKSVIYDEYFTALGADGLREVIILKGGGHTMYVTIIWGSEKIHSVNRVVVKS